MLLSTRNTVDCTSARLRTLAGTLEAARIVEICTPVMTGTLNTTDALGLASFFTINLVRGPPGSYNLKFSAGDYSASTRIQVFSNLYTLMDHVEALGIDSVAPSELTVGEPLQQQPAFLLIDRRGNPVPEKQALCYVSGSPFFFNKDLIVKSNLVRPPCPPLPASLPPSHTQAPSLRFVLLFFPSGWLTRPLPCLLVVSCLGIDQRGQQFGELTNSISALSDDRGVIQFSGLTVTASSTPIMCVLSRLRCAPTFLSSPTHAHLRYVCHAEQVSLLLHRGYCVFVVSS